MSARGRTSGCALVALVAGACLACVGGVDSARAQETSRCAGETIGPPGPQEPVGKVSRLQEKSVRFALGGDRDATDRTVGIDATPPLNGGAQIFAELAGDLERSDGGDSFPVEGIVVQTTTTQAGSIRLRVCVDPAQPEHVERGRYVGSIKLTGPRIEPTAITLEASLRLPAWVAGIVLVFGVIVGLIMKALGDKKSTEEMLKALQPSVQAGDTPTAERKFTLTDYVKGSEFISGAIVGLLLAAVAYAQIYDSDPDWGTPLDIVTLGFAGVAAVVSGKTAVDVVAPYVPSVPK